MTVVSPSAPPAGPPPPHRTAEEWLRSLGNVPLERILVNPPLGTATVADVIRFAQVEGRGVELIDGSIVEKPAGFLESLIASRIITLLTNYAANKRLGVVAGEHGMIRMAMGNIRMPDVAFFRYQDFLGGRIPTEPAPRVAPVLAVEVLSASNTDEEMRIKIREYFENGVKIVWTLDPSTRTVRVYESPDRLRQFAGDDRIDGGDDLPGFSAKLSELFDV